MHSLNAKAQLVVEKAKFLGTKRETVETDIEEYSLVLWFNLISQIINPCRVQALLGKV